MHNTKNEDQSYLTLNVIKKYVFNFEYVTTHIDNIIFITRPKINSHTQHNI